jgi:DNA invertase Pin-like site-specific DNA recombinase
VHTQQHKVTADHLRRNAYLYVRQSTLRQVVENTESTRRQYGLREKATTLGWPTEQIVVIDTDQGQSGASTDREGFQRLVSEVGLGRAGIVIGLEVSRLARNSSDWHRLLEICALTNTLILDEDGLYDPSHFNDRLLLGLKGTMSEAELHVLRAWLQGGLINKARRGELNFLLPVGLVRDHRDRVILEPDQQVQQAIRLFFETYERSGTATGIVRFFRERELRFPRRLQRGVRKGEIVWGSLRHSRALQVLHNPRYSGTYVYGRHRVEAIRASSGWKILLICVLSYLVVWDQVAHWLYPAMSSVARERLLLSGPFLFSSAHQRYRFSKLPRLLPDSAIDSR